MKKILRVCATILMFFLTSTITSYAQEEQPSEITSAAFLNLGGSVWGAGGGLEWQSNHLALFGGVGSGYVTSDVFYSGGLKYYFRALPKGSFFLGIGYGKTAHIEETLTTWSGVVLEESDDLFGPSFLAGYKWLFGQTKRVGLSLGAAALYTPDLPDWAEELDIEPWEYVPIVHLDIRLF